MQAPGASYESETEWPGYDADSWVSVDTVRGDPGSLTDSILAEEIIEAEAAAKLQAVCRGHAVRLAAAKTRVDAARKLYEQRRNSRIALILGGIIITIAAVAFAGNSVVEAPSAPRLLGPPEDATAKSLSFPILARLAAPPPRPNNRAALVLTPSSPTEGASPVLGLALSLAALLVLAMTSGTADPTMREEKDPSSETCYPKKRAAVDSGPASAKAAAKAAAVAAVTAKVAAKAADKAAKQAAKAATVATAKAAAAAAEAAPSTPRAKAPVDEGVPKPSMKELKGFAESRGLTAVLRDANGRFRSRAAIVADLEAELAQEAAKGEKAEEAPPTRRELDFDVVGALRLADSPKKLTWNELQRIAGGKKFTKEQLSLLWSAYKQGCGLEAGRLGYNEFRAHVKGRGISREVESAMWVQHKLLAAQ